MIYKLTKILFISVIIFLAGCSSKAGIFVKANLNPLPPNELTLSDGYKATYYAIQKGNPDEVDTLLFFVQGSEHVSLNYYLRTYFEGLHGNFEILALQKRHIGHREAGLFGPSDKFHHYNYFSQRVRDEREFIIHILNKDNYPDKNIVIFGVSEGGDIAAALASTIPQITHLVILGSGGMKTIDSFRIWVNKYHIDFDRFYKDVRKYPESIAKRGYGQTYKYWASILSIDPMDYFRNINIPILVAAGEKDENSPVESVYFLENEFKMLKKQNLTVKLFPDCNHNLVDSQGNSHREELLNYASNWWSSH